MPGRVWSVSGPVVVATGMVSSPVGNQVSVGERGLVGEIVAISGDKSIIQVYEDTTGLSPGQEVYDKGYPLSVELGPGLIGNIFDGIQRPLDRIRAKCGIFVENGVQTSPLDRDRHWDFKPILSLGDHVEAGMVLGEVEETSLITHRILVPLGIEGEITWIAGEGKYRIEDVVARVKTTDGREVELKMYQRWPVRKKRPVRQRLRPEIPLITGQRVIDFLFPVALGGVSAIPGGFGTGKTITQHQLAKWASAEVVIYIGCGERGNEITQVLDEFPKLQDPRTGKPLIERTIIIANTSNMPVAAREASVYTGITLAEYYRDQGYNVALMADSTSRWAEALREIAGRLEMMPAEEGYPAYLAARLGEFYERAGYAEVLNGSKGSITVIGAVSPPGGDFSEPVTMHTKRFVRTFWALDKRLAGQRHFPSINWMESYSGYVNDLTKWWDENVKNAVWSELRQEIMTLLQEADRLEKVAQLIGVDALPDAQRLIIETSRLVRFGFLQQNAYSSVDSFCSPEKGVRIIEIILEFYRRANEMLSLGIHVLTIVEMGIFSEIMRLKEEIPNDQLDRFEEFKEEMSKAFQELEAKYGTGI